MSSPSRSKSTLILTLVNTVVILVAAGLMFYTKMVFKRPDITEESERAKLEAIKAKPKKPTIPARIDFEPTTINIAPNPAQPKPADNTEQQIQGKMHYATLAFSIEIRDEEKKPDVERLRPIIQDKLLSILGHKTFQELTHFQGRYVLRNQLIDTINQLLLKAGPSEEYANLVSNFYFTQFTVQ